MVIDVRAFPEAIKYHTYAGFFVFCFLVFLCVCVGTNA